MNIRAILGCCLWLLSGSVSADAPAPLTGWRGARGIELSWADASRAWTIWRGTEPGRLMPMITMPAGQTGFLDFSVARTGRYFYALGDPKAHGDPLEFPGAPGVTRILAGLVTTCSGLQKGGLFPADTQNWFFASRNAHVQYFGYYFLKPFDPGPREAKVVWRDPAGAVFSEYTHSVTPKRVDLADGPAGQILLAQAMGLREALPQNGQKRVPTQPGLYTIETFIENVPVALTVWYLREEGTSPKSGGASPVPVSTGAGPGAAPSGLPRTLPLPPISEP